MTIPDTYDEVYDLGMEDAENGRANRASDFEGEAFAGYDDGYCAGMGW